MTIEEKLNRSHELMQRGIQNIRKRSKRSDEELDKSVYKILYLTEKQAEEKIKELMDGPDSYWMEEDGVPHLISREELIENVRSRIR